MNAYRYTLEPYKGMKTRYPCPNDCKGKTFTRYIDTKTGEHLPYEYGKCEKVNKCGYHLNPYKSGYAKIIWLKEQKNEKWKEIEPKKTSFAQIKASKFQPIFIPFDIFKNSLGRYNGNSFVQFLTQSFGKSIAAELVQRFYIGTSKYWEGSAVFWLINENSKVAGGQVILFEKNGNTKKEIRPDGSKKRFNSWVHIALKNNYQNNQKLLPNWLGKYIENSPKFPCLFGLPQLEKECPTKPIAIVESAKTAVIATAYLPQYIWMAVGSLSYLNSKRLYALKGRNITLFPDRGGYEKWNEKAMEISCFANVTVSDLLERKEAVQGSDLADYLLKYPISDFIQPMEENSKNASHSFDVWINKEGQTIKTPINEMGYPVSWG